jgi:hypothetical protein
MKNYIKLMIAVLSIVSLLMVVPQYSLSQAPPPPPEDEEGYGHGSSHDSPPPEGGSAPLGSGVAILLAMGAGYGVWKYRKEMKKE